MNNAHNLAHTENAKQFAPNPICALNDFFRRNLFAVGSMGDVVLTAGVSALNDFDRYLLLEEVRCFEDFNEDNDPYGEHDFGRIDFKGERYFFKFDYYDRAKRAHSPNPASSGLTCRVLTIMRAEEY